MSLLFTCAFLGYHHRAIRRIACIRVLWPILCAFVRPLSVSLGSLAGRVRSLLFLIILHIYDIGAPYRDVVYWYFSRFVIVAMRYGYGICQHMTHLIHSVDYPFNQHVSSAAQIHQMPLLFRRTEDARSWSMPFNRCSAVSFCVPHSVAE